MSIKMVVGLGNPGRKYESTRHNIGRRVIDFLDDSKIRLPGIVLFKSDEFMNTSGGPVAEQARKKGFSADELLVVLDDFELPLGRLRIRKNGSSGGHNGLKSVLESLGTEDVPRLRVGIGPVPDGKDPADFVLERFSSREEPSTIIAVTKAANAVISAIKNGLDVSMNEYNKKEEAPSPPPSPAKGEGEVK